MAEQIALEANYLVDSDELRQSGFGGGTERWRAERSPLVEAVDRDGSFLDVGCANGRLVRDVQRWAGERGNRLAVHGIDIGKGLVQLARAAAGPQPDRFAVADAWHWEPDHQWTYVYARLDQSPRALWCLWIDRLESWVEPGGRLIMASYGSRGRGVAPEDVGDVMRSCGRIPVGVALGGSPPVTAFAWIDL